MPKISNELGPIRSQPVAGPAVDAWAARKEGGDAPVARAADFRANFDGALKSNIVKTLALLNIIL